MSVVVLFGIGGVWLILAGLVAADARQYESESAGMWFIVVALFGFFGLILYMFQKPKPDGSNPGQRSRAGEVILPSSQRNE